MKKALLSFTLMGVITIALIASCSKNYNSKGTGTQSLNQLFAGLRTTPENLSVTAGRDTIVYGAQGTMLHFYTNSFKDGSGNIITSGTIYLSLIEMYKPGDMIANRAPTTTSTGQLLKSGGEINITATVNGQTIYANKYGIGFKQPAASTDTMYVYYGGASSPDSVTTWTQSDQSQNGAAANHTDTSHIYPSYIFDTCVYFTYVNCDRLYNSNGQNTTVSIVVPDASFDKSNTQLFLIFPTINCITASDSREGYTASTNTFIFGNHENEVPVGVQYELVVITYKTTGYYCYIQSGITTSGMTINAAMAPDTQQDIKDRLAGL